MEGSVAVVTDHDAMKKIREFVGTEDNAAAVEAIQHRFEGTVHPSVTGLQEENQSLRDQNAALTAKLMEFENPESEEEVEK